MNENLILLERFQNWLAAVPPSVFLAISLAVATVLLVVGILQILHFNRARQVKAEQRRGLEREMKLRYETYLPAAEALARAQEHLANYPMLDVGREGTRTIADHIVGALGKVHLVGSEAVIRATGAVATEFTNASLSLAAKRRPLEQVEQDIEQIDKQTAHLGFERDRLMTNLTRAASDGLDQMDGVWNDMNLRFDKLHREIGTLLERRGERVRELNRLRQALSQEAARYALRIAKLSVPAYLTLRQEMELPLDEDAYRALAQRSIREIEQQLSQLAPPAKRSAKASAEALPSAPAARLKMALRRG